MPLISAEDKDRLLKALPNLGGQDSDLDRIAASDLDNERRQVQLGKVFGKLRDRIASSLVDKLDDPKVLESWQADLEKSATDLETLVSLYKDNKISEAQALLLQKPQLIELRAKQLLITLKNQPESNVAVTEKLINQNQLEQFRKELNAAEGNAEAVKMSYTNVVKASLQTFEEWISKTAESGEVGALNQGVTSSEAYTLGIKTEDWRCYHSAKDGISTGVYISELPGDSPAAYFDLERGQKVPTMGGRTQGEVDAQRKEYTRLSRGDAIVAVGDDRGWHRVHDRNELFTTLSSLVATKYIRVEVKKGGAPDAAKLIYVAEKDRLKR